MIAAALVLGGIGLVFVLDPTTCDGDVCRANAAIDVGIVAAGALAAILVLRLGGR